MWWRTLNHGLGPVFVDFDELFRLEGHLLSDVPTHEDRLEARPEQLHFHPKLETIRGVAQFV